MISPYMGAGKAFPAPIWAWPTARIMSTGGAGKAFAPAMLGGRRSELTPYSNTGVTSYYVNRWDVFAPPSKKEKVNQVSEYICNQVAVDWLTLTTWQESAYRELSDFLIEHGGAVKEQSRLQYKGIAVGEGVFIGTAIQAGQEHYMVQGSGARADWLAFAMLDPEYGLKTTAWQPTRIDLQLTLLVPDYRLRGWQWVARSRGRRVQHVTENGLDTIYIGSRKGDKFLRIYVKEESIGRLQQHLGQYIRWEYELSGAHARGLWADMLMGRDPMGNWAHLYDVTMNGAQGSRSWRDVICPVLADAFADIPTRGYQRDTRQSDTMNWLETAVSSSVSKMLNDDDNRYRMHRLLDLWYREAGESSLLERYNI